MKRRFRAIPIIVAVSFIGCEDSTPVEPESAIAPSFANGSQTAWAYLGTMGPPDSPWLEGTIRVFDVSSRGEVARFAVQYPFDLALSPDGTLLYVLSGQFTEPDELLVLSTPNLTLVNRRSVATNLEALAVSPDGAYLYIARISSFAAPLRSELMVLNSGDLTTEHAITFFGRAEGGIAASPGGQFVYVVRSEGDVVVIDPAAGTVLTTIPVGTVPVDVDFAPNGRVAYVTNTGSNDVTVIDAVGHTVLATIAQLGANKPSSWPNSAKGRGHMSRPFGLSFTSDGTRAYVSVGSELVEIDAVTHTVVDRITVQGWSPGNQLRDIAMTPDDEAAWVTNFGGGKGLGDRLSPSIEVINIRTGNAPNAQCERAALNCSRLPLDAQPLHLVVGLDP